MLSILLTVASSQLLNCTGKPMTAGDVRRLWHSCDDGCDASVSQSIRRYDKRARPELAHWVAAGPVGPGPTSSGPAAPIDKVFVSMQLNTLTEVNTKKQTITGEFFVRTMWYDRRLEYDDSCLSQVDSSFDGTDLTELWTPEIVSSAWAKPALVEQSTMWVEPDGWMWLLQKVHMEFKCPMDFRQMPFDTQTCHFTLSSIRYNDAQLELALPNATLPSYRFYGMDGGVNYVCAASHVVGGDVSWKVSDFRGYTEGSHSQTIDTYSSIHYQLSVTRDPDFFAQTAVVPMLIIMVVCWASFFVSRAAVPARVAIGIIAFLALSGVVNSVNAKLPQIGGFVWLREFATITQYCSAICIIEFSIAHFVGRVEGRIDKARDAARKQLEKQAADSATSTQEVTVVTDGGKAAAEGGGKGAADADGATALREAMSKSLGPIARCLTTRTGQPLVRDQHFDIFSRFAFPVVYGIILAYFYSKVPVQPQEDPRISTTSVCPPR